MKINYLYFAVFFALLVFTSSTSLFAKDALTGSRLFFFLYAVGQAALETSLLIFVAWLLRTFVGKLAFSFFIGATFLFAGFHILDFFMDRLLDLSVWETLSAFVFNESLDNFLNLLDASGLPLWAWAALTLAGLFLPLVGVYLYKWSEKITDQKPLEIRWESFCQGFICLPAALLFWEFSASKAVHPDTYTAFTQSLPWKSTFLRPASVMWEVPGAFAPPLSEGQMEERLALYEAKLEKRPNIYIFVTESLRRDAITAETAPHLDAFSKESASADFTLSGGNGSHLSWFSIFHSAYPQGFAPLQDAGWKMGAPPLNLLKKWGYKVRLYSSAQLSYYGMESLLFGEKGALLDSYQTFHHTSAMSAAETDKQAVEALQNDLAKDPELHEGQVCIVFWDATHFDYSWPKSWVPKFTPFTKDFGFFKSFFSGTKIEHLKNRYRNAIHYVDSLFGEFLNKMPHPDEAVVVFVGDHGEEFLERGHLFHGSHLVHEQTNVPLFMRFGSFFPKRVEGVMSQLDIFPSILHFLSGKESDVFAGQSVFKRERVPYAMVSRFNAGRAPYEFCLHNGKHKIVAQFSKRDQIFEAQPLYIRSIRRADDEPLYEGRRNVEAWVEEEFGSAFRELFPKK